jgi:AhpD family alkylhydroperoxidase
VADLLSSHRPSATGEEGVRSEERALGDGHGEGANGAAPGAAELAGLTTAGRQKPILGLREFTRSTAALVRRGSELRAIWFEGRLDPAFREEVMVAVAGDNNCRQCSFAHREWALAEGLPKDELAALEGQEPESFDPRKWAAIAWAGAAARSRFGEVPDVIEANFRRQFSVQEQADIELVARTMCWMNRTSNTVDAAWSRVQGRPVPGSGVLLELPAVLIYAVVTPLVLVVLSVKQRRSPISLIRSVGPFFREFDARKGTGDDDRRTEPA